MNLNSQMMEAVQTLFGGLVAALFGCLMAFALLAPDPFEHPAQSAEAASQQDAALRGCLSEELSMLDDPTDEQYATADEWCR